MAKNIPLSNGVDFTIVDDDVFEELSKKRWYLHLARNSKCKYALTGMVTAKNGLRKRQTVFMHRLIMGFPQSYIDHINGNSLDNRRCNLRLCTASQNQMNQRTGRGVSGYKGVSWKKQCSRWMVGIKVGEKNLYLGVYKTKEEAALVYNEAAKKYYGEFARLNNIKYLYGV